MKKYILLLLILQSIYIEALAQEIVKGRVVDAQTNEALPGATIKVKNPIETIVTDKNGFFELALPKGDYHLTISYLGYIQNEHNITIPLLSELRIELKKYEQTLQEVEILNIGYKEIARSGATGSYTQIGQDLLNRNGSTSNILERLNGITSGLIFNNNGARQFAQSDIEIHGRATLFSNASPLIIVDNFPYEGEITNLNPNDVESITVLKDAAAAALWGSRSGNGVIVITTKKGKQNSKTRINVNTSMAITGKPDLFARTQLSSKEYIEIEQFLFNKGAYNGIINTGYQTFSPAVSIMLDKRNGKINTSEETLQLTQLATIDSRDQLLSIYHHVPIYQQAQVSLNGGGANNSFYYGIGYNRNFEGNLKTNNDRLTLNTNNTFFLLNSKLSINSQIAFTHSNSENGHNLQAIFPYTQFANDEGQALPIALTYRADYISQAGNGKLLDWTYKPLDELNKEYTINTNINNDFRINLLGKYALSKMFNALIGYSFTKRLSEGLNLFTLESYYVRNLINQFTQISPSNGAFTYPVPIGGIKDITTNNLRSHQVRAQLDFKQKWSQHSFSAIGGVEMRDLGQLRNSYRYYGYDIESATNQNTILNYETQFPYFYNTSLKGRISPNSNENLSTDRFFSYYLNTDYNFKNRYFIALNARRDASNLFGVSANQKGVPLWSLGFSWAINQEKFNPFKALSILKLRASYGYTGLVNNTVSAYLTAKLIGQNLYNANYSNIINPPNPDLRWERIKNHNLGIDLSSTKNTISGSLDFWKKEGLDLIGNSPLAPQTGNTLYTGNSANTITKGIDLNLRTTNINSIIKWYSNYLYSYTQSKVTKYLVSNGTNQNVVSANYNNPLEGYPYYSLFSYKYNGLDKTGAPIGQISNIPSTDYSTIMSSVDRTNLIYNGSAVPIHFGNIRNDLNYKNFDLSINVSFKLGYFFRRSSLHNGIIYNTSGNNYVMADYQNRWQKPGDELFTNVPSLIYPSNVGRDNLYQYSAILITPADHIRLQDIRLGYTYKPQKNKNTILNMYLLISNMGVLWKKNTFGIDPDQPYGITPAKSFSLGLQANL